MREPNLDAKVSVQRENIRAEFRLERFKAELGGMRTYEISQNRCKVLRDTPPRQVAKVNPRDWSLHRLWLRGQGMGYGKCEGLAFQPDCSTSNRNCSVK